MKKISGSHTGGMPMLEIIITIGIFTAISVFILNLFVSADTLENRAMDTSKAVLCAENAAEAIRAADSFAEVIEVLGLKEEKGTIRNESGQSIQLDVLEDGMGTDLYYTAHYDKDWKMVDEKSMFCLLVVPSAQEDEFGSMIYADIFVYHWKNYTDTADNNGQLVHLLVKNYSPKEQT